MPNWLTPSMIGWRRLSVPVNDGRFFQAIIQFHQEALTWIEEKAAGAVRLTQPEHRGGTAVDFDRTRLDEQTASDATAISAADCRQTARPMR
jgi:hypothetical protein